VLHVHDATTVRSNSDALIYRVTRDSVRDAQSDAEARSVQIDVTRRVPGIRRPVVEDDGRGPTGGDLECRGPDAHPLGLALAEGLAPQAGGALSVRAAADPGTSVELVVPAR
jgi:signal transduction histidine kinase